MAVLRAERWGMLDEIFGTACRRQTRLRHRRRGHMHQPVLQTNPHGERRGEDMFSRFIKLEKYDPPIYQLLFFLRMILSSFIVVPSEKNIIVL